MCLLERLLVAGMEMSEVEADGTGVRLQRDDLGDDLIDLPRREGLDHLSEAVHPFYHLESPRAGDDRFRL